MVYIYVQTVLNVLLYFAVTVVLVSGVQKLMMVIFVSIAMITTTLYAPAADVLFHTAIHTTLIDEDTHDNPYCESCYPDRENDEIIHDYYYKPSPIFYSLDKNNNESKQQCMSSLQRTFPKASSTEQQCTNNKYQDKLYLGVELEIDEGGECVEYAEKLLDIANNNNDHIYIKHDGSIDDGFEIVSHPMTMSYHKNIMPWYDILIKAVRMGYVSHNTDTCGLHVHVNRSAFGNSKEEQETVTGRLVYFFEKFWSEMLRFSRAYRITGKPMGIALRRKYF